MIRINLLPHRELKRKARQQQIAVLAGMVGFLGLLVVWGVHDMIAEKIEFQNSRNQYLNEQVAILDKEIAEIREIKNQTQELLTRKQIVETLQNSRSEVVYLLDQLVRLLPDGVYLQSIKQEGHNITLVGYAQSNAWVSTLMRNLESSPWLESPLLIEIKAMTINNVRQNEFNMKIKLKQASVNDVQNSSFNAAG
ncbi:PilN domain-containing protein [Nitrosomonas ureae]|uniref:Type IV pilus assembly protein PilN n=1 Tax=Nitrosomonas ureae TaxID=44577 RepID=A0A0S3AJI2_9PROT|nr:PilN domain-containing protein [Nitrosomonas ureae]ALQ51292.1 fimbrial protein [Nitrosomonas ureae]PXX15497.1 type IV pilus assembly protein PilN [Nitrosomonas ureae]SDU25271.1 type IV pilus assembly protein PilN [Nitrosomonas ureae]SEQ14153.1 type IV pilus assembly protein PilN [Nitrosomonas ureae]